MHSAVGRPHRLQVGEVTRHRRLADLEADGEEAEQVPDDTDLRFGQVWGQIGAGVQRIWRGSVIWRGSLMILEK